MTKYELDKLSQLIKQEAKALKSATEARKAQNIADFEEKISKKYCISHNPEWAKLAAQAEEIIEKLNAMIHSDLKSQGIEEELMPQAYFAWQDRGENALAKRRAELRTLAKAQAEEQQKAAQVRIELWSVAEAKELLSCGLESEDARNFLLRRPSLERLMPILEFADIEKELAKEEQVNSDRRYLPYHWERRV